MYHKGNRAWLFWKLSKEDIISRSKLFVYAVLFYLALALLVKVTVFPFFDLWDVRKYMCFFLVLSALKNMHNNIINLK